MGALSLRLAASHKAKMKHNNQIHSVRKFRKYWQRYVKTWFNQPARKKSRRTARDKKAAAIAPRPVSGCVRPVVHGPTVKYNSKVRIGRGFSLAEIKDAGVGKKEARSLGIAVDHRRRNRSVQGKAANVQRLREYRAQLVVFPRKENKGKKGWKDDADAAETEVAETYTGVIMRPVKAEAELESWKLTAQEADPKTRVTQQLKAAWNDSRLVGFREKRAKERADKAAAEALKKSK